MSNDVVVTDDRYVIPGVGTYPRLSTVMGIEPAPGLEIWKKSLPPGEMEHILEVTSQWGTDVHMVTQLSDEGKEDEMWAMVSNNPDLLEPLLVWQSWVNEFIDKWLAIEMLVWSKKLGVAGTIDRVGVIKGDKYPSIIDIKTGTLVDEIGIRLAGYRLMWNEMKPVKPHKKVVRTMAAPLSRVNLKYSLMPKEYQPEKYEGKFIQLCQDYNALIV